MKKITFLFFVLCLSSFVNAQFKATPNGVATEDGKEFYVVEIEGKTASELYKSALGYILSNFKNPDVVSNKLENEMINLHGVYTDRYRVDKTLGIVVYAHVDMNLIMYFKDGKVRFDIPIIHSMRCGGKGAEVYFGGSSFIGSITMFKKNGSIRNKKAVEGFNKFINEVVNDIVDSMKYDKKSYSFLEFSSSLFSAFFPSLIISILAILRSSSSNSSFGIAKSILNLIDFTSFNFISSLSFFSFFPISKLCFANINQIVDYC